MFTAQQLKAKMISNFKAAEEAGDKMLGKI